jgi:hypothetical protein
MSAKTTKTIDDIGIDPYLAYEQNRKFFDQDYAKSDKTVAPQLITDVTNPIIISDYQMLFEINTKGASWSLMPAPDEYNLQKGRLFTHQLAPKLGPEDLIEFQIGKISQKVEEETNRLTPKKRGRAKAKPEVNKELEEIKGEADTLINMMKNIQNLNKIIQQISSERYRYGKG